MNITMVRASSVTPISTVEQGGEAILHLAAGDDSGSTDGVGRYVAAKLAASGAKVLIHGRDSADR